MALGEDIPEGDQNNFRKQSAWTNKNITKKNVDAKNKGKEMFWGNQTTAAHSAHSVPIVSHSPTLENIPEEGEEHSEDDGMSHENVYSRTRPRHRPAFSNKVFESNLHAKNTSCTYLVTPQNRTTSSSEGAEKSMEIMDQQITDILFQNLQLLKTNLLEAKEQKQSAEENLDLSRKQNEQILKENNSLKEKISDFQKQEEKMIADRRELTSQLVSAREKVAQFELLQTSSKEVNDKNQGSKLKEEIVKLKTANDFIKGKLESCQSTVRKVVEENASLKNNEKSLQSQREQADKEVKRLTIELAVWKQKVTKLENCENSSVTSSLISCQKINDESDLITGITLKPNVSYVEIVSTTPGPRPINPIKRTAEKSGNSDKNKAITVIKDVRRPANNMQQVKPQNKNESSSRIQNPNNNKGNESIQSPRIQNPNNNNKGNDSNSMQSPRVQNPNNIKGIGSLLVSEDKQSIARRIDSKSITDRLLALEQQIRPMMNLIESSQKNQEKMAKELDGKLNHSIAVVTNQITALRNLFQNLLKSQSQNTIASQNGTNTASKANRRSISNFGLQKSGTINKSPSKSNIPVLIKKL